MSYLGYMAICLCNHSLMYASTLVLTSTCREGTCHSLA